MISKSFALAEQLGPVFDLTCDCEDGSAVTGPSVAGQELAHAELICQLISAKKPSQLRTGVRVHPFSSPLCASEIELFVRQIGPKLAYITIPKIADFAEAKSALEAVRTCCAKNGLPKPIPVHLLIETMQAVADVQRIAELPGIEVLDFGLMDFISEHQGAIPAACMRSPGQFEHQQLIRAKTEIAAAALRCGIVPSHNVSVAFSDPETTRADAALAHQRFGFLRMWSIHPAQIPAIVAGMTPAGEDLLKMESILLAGYRNQWAPIAFEEVLHDRASYRYFWDCVRRAHISGAKLSPETLRLFFSL